MELSRVQPDVFKVCVAHDLWLYPAERELRIGERAPEVDSLFISSELWQWPRNKGRIKRLSMASLRHEEKRHQNLTLTNSMHHNFHDLSLIAPWVGKKLRMLGPGDAYRMIHAVNTATREFLQGQVLSPSPVLVPFQAPQGEPVDD